MPRMAVAVYMTIYPSHPYNAGTEDVGFSPTRQAFLAPCAKNREVFGESHGRVASHPPPREPVVRRISLHADDGVQVFGVFFFGVATAKDSNGFTM